MFLFFVFWKAIRHYGPRALKFFDFTVFLFGACPTKIVRNLNKVILIEVVIKELLIIALKWDSP